MLKGTTSALTKTDQGPDLRPLSYQNAAQSSPNQRPMLAIRRLIMQAQALQGDPQHDLARPRRPAHPLFRHLQPFQKTTAAQHHIAKPRPQIPQRQRHTVARIPRPAGHAIPGRTAPTDERQPSWPVPTTTLAGGAERKSGMPVWRAAAPA